MEEMYDSWDDDDDMYTNENGIPFWDLEQREEEYRAWEFQRDEEN